MKRRGAFDGLEPQREEVHHQRHRRRAGEGEPSSRGDSALRQNMRWYHSCVFLPCLDGGKRDDADGEDDKEGNDATRAPGVLGASPLQCEQEADNTGEGDDRAEGVQLRELLFPR